MLRNMNMTNMQYKALNCPDKSQIHGRSFLQRKRPKEQLTVSMILAHLASKSIYTSDGQRWSSPYNIQRLSTDSNCFCVLVQCMHVLCALTTVLICKWSLFPNEFWWWMSYRYEQKTQTALAPRTRRESWCYLSWKKDARVRTAHRETLVAKQEFSFWQSVEQAIFNKIVSQQNLTTLTLCVKCPY